MLNVISIQFDKTQKHQNPVGKVVYSKGEIIGRPKSSKLHIINKADNISINNNFMKYLKQNPPNQLYETKRNIKTAKTRKKKIINVEIPLLDDDEKYYTGNIWKHSFTQEELKNKVDIDPDPRVNMKKEKISKMEKTTLNSTKHHNNQRNKTIQQNKLFNITEEKGFIPNNADNNNDNQEDVKSIKSTNPPIQKQQKKEISEYYLKRTIRQYEENSRLQKKAQSIIENSKTLNIISRPSLVPEEPAIKFVPIKDITTNKSYIQAEKDMHKYKEDCEYLMKQTEEITRKIKEDNQLKATVLNNTTLKQKNEITNKAETIINNVKDNIDPDHFDLHTLNQNDFNLITSCHNYKPSKHNNKSKKVELDPELRVKLINQIILNNKKSEEIREQRYKENYLWLKEDILKEDWKHCEYDYKAHYDNFNRGKKVDLKNVKNAKDKIDIYDYIYITSIKDEGVKTGKMRENNKKNNTYQHPFLIDDDED